MLAKSKLLLVCIAVCLICLYWTLLRTSATPPPNLDSYSIEPHSFLPPAPPRTSYKPQDASKEVYATLLSTQLHGDDSKEDKYFNATRVLVHQLLHVNRTMGYRNVLVGVRDGWMVMMKCLRACSTLSDTTKIKWTVIEGVGDPCSCSLEEGSAHPGRCNRQRCASDFPTSRCAWS